MKWMAHIIYKTDPPEKPRGILKLFDEMEDLHDIIEGGPCYYSIESINIILIENSCEKDAPCDCGAFEKLYVPNDGGSNE